MSKPIRCEKEAPMSPHICCRCRAHAAIREYMVDVGVDFQYEGTMYFCNMCMKDIINAVPDALTIDVLVSKEEHHLTQLMELQDELTQARRLKARLDELGISVSISPEEEQDVTGINGEVDPEPDGNESAIIESDSGTAADDQQAIFTSVGTIAFK